MSISRTSSSTVALVMVVSVGGFIVFFCEIEGLRDQPALETSTFKILNRKVREGFAKIGKDTFASIGDSVTQFGTSGVFE
jgi:hypothetical protein